MAHLRSSTFKMVAALAAVTFVSSGLHAQTFSEHKWNFNVGAGVTPALGTTGDRMNTGWHYTLGGGYSFNTREALMLEFSQTEMGVSNSVLNNLNVPDGNARIYSVTLDPVYRFWAGAHVGAYGIAGVGYYRRTVEFTQPTTAIVPVFSPWFGYIGPVAIPANEVIGSFSSNAVGLNVGLGFTIGNPEGGPKFYTEVRYHWVNTRNSPTDILPITLGIRW
jgi:Outer membrane protein beta-barrel domain